MPREFDLGDVLTITTGRLVAARHIDAVYDLLGYMTGDTLWTHQLPRAADECRPRLLEQHPALAEVEPPADFLDKQACLDWVASLVPIYGATLPVEPLAAEDHTSIGPLRELGLMGVSQDRIIPLVVPED